MKAVDFYKLPRAIQDRFVGSVMSGFPPAPLLAIKGAKPTKLVWLALTGGCLVTLVIVTRVGYGSLDSGLALHSWKALILYAALIFGIAFGLVQAFARLVRERALPYAAGVYLFPACLIDARSDQFKVHSTQDIIGVDAQGGSVRVAFSGGSAFVFPCTDPAQAAGVVSEVQGARDRAMHAKATEDPKELVAVDPLHNPRFSSPVGPRDPYDMRLPPWKKLGPVVALAVAAILAPTLWALRNNGSDKTMYARATMANDTDSYRAYLERGRKFKDEVAGTLLPRAELRDAERAGTVDALLKFKTEHPGTKIGPEVSVSIRTAMLSELEKAKAVGTLAALDEFGKHYPDHGVEPELRAAIHAVYMRELEAYKKRASTKDKNVVPFVERLFAWAEQHGPAVEIRFRRKKSESMGRADQYVAKTPSFMGEVSYPSKQFDEKKSTRRENALGKALAPKFDAGLSPELFDVTLGAQIPQEVETLPDVKVPTLFISESADWSGHSYVSQKPRGSYVGITFPFEAMFVIPGDAKPIKLKADVFKQAALGVLKDEDNIMPGPAEEKVYETMATDAFEAFGNKVLALFFAKETPAK
ncbi:MAG: hypothetical protein JWO86_7631 [Myxococcaceae bacterium]|nr:hypothetical protein [Myxococcaceae bacterium]MEA2752025.1 hypothetical protein [Myxococcales bacterium]